MGFELGVKAAISSWKLEWKLEPFIHSEEARLAAKGNKGSRKSFKALKKVKVTGWVTDLRWARNTARSPYRRTRQHSKGGESPRKDELSLTNVAPGIDKNMDGWMNGWKSFGLLYKQIFLIFIYLDIFLPRSTKTLPISLKCQVLLTAWTKHKHKLCCWGKKNNAKTILFEGDHLVDQII